MNSLPILQLRRGKDESLRRFHPWVFSGAIARCDEGIEDGDLVIVGGNVSDNFSPYSAVWLLKVGGNSQTSATMFLSKNNHLLLLRF